MLAQRIRKVSRFQQSILKTNRFLIYWLTEIQSDNLLCGRENEESVCLVSFNGWFCGKRLLNLKKSLKKRRVELKKKISIVLIRVHLETFRITVVKRFQVAFIREIWLPVRENGRFVLYPGESRIIRESWHVG